MRKIDQYINIYGMGDTYRLPIAGEIINLNYPNAVYENTPFQVSYSAHNFSGNTYTFFGYLSIGGNMIVSTYWENDIYPNATFDAPIFDHPGITEPLTLTITLGHFEEETEICQWIIDNGGYNNLTVGNVFTIIDSYLFNIPPSGYTFIPDIQQVFGVIDYYLGFNGDTGTGCSFYGGI